MEKSNNYVERLLTSLNQQRSRNEHCDVSIRINDTSYPVHKCVIAAVSPYLHDLMSQVKMSTVDVAEKVPASVFGLLLDFIYVGKVSIEEKTAKDLLSAGQLFGITELVALCEKYAADREDRASQKDNQRNFRDHMQATPTAPRESLTDNRTSPWLENQFSDIEKLFSKLSMGHVYRGTSATPRQKRERTALIAHKPKNAAKPAEKPERQVIKIKAAQPVPKKPGGNRNEIGDNLQSLNGDKASSTIIRTGQGLREDNKPTLTSKSPKENKPRGSYRSKARIGAALTTAQLKRKLEYLPQDKLIRYGIRRLEKNETLDSEEFPFTLIHYECDLDASSPSGNSIQLPQITESIAPHGSGSGTSHEYDSERFVCNYCKACFQNNESLLVHKEREHRSIRCQFCPKSFFRREEVSQHVIKTHNKRESICKECNIVFSATKKFVEHMDVAHGILKPFPCLYEGCDSSFKSVTKLNEHQETHEGHRTPCVFCGLECKSKSALARHMRTCNGAGNTKESMCHLCAGTFSRKRELQRHISSVHERKKNFPCDVCGKALSDAAALMRHKRTIHSDEYRYHCNICSAKYKHSNSLKDHKSRKHKEVLSSVSEKGVSFHQDDFSRHSRQISTDASG